MLMKFIRIVVFAVTAFTIIVFGIVFAREKILADKTIPVFKVEDGVLEVSSSATDEDLLKGVTVIDGKDGDITDRVIVTSIGKFTDVGYCKVTYAVSDSDNHVVLAHRQIHYNDYTSPKFTMNAPLVFSIYEDVNVVGIIGATDCLDGDISNNVIIYSPDYESGIEGKYSIQATVMNSKGDSSQITLPLIVEHSSNTPAEIELNTYLIYSKKGEMPDFKSYIKNTYDCYGVSSKFDITIKTNFNANIEGNYYVDYYGTDAIGHAAHTRLIVVVE